MIDQIYLNDVPYYRKLNSLVSTPSYKHSVDLEISKFKRTTLSSFESTLRQAKLLQSIRSSGEDEKLIELIDKWENAIKEVIKELYSHQTGDRSMKKFVKKLGLNWDDLGFSDQEDEEESDLSETENEEIGFKNENSEQFNNYNFDENDYKRIKYED